MMSISAIKQMSDHEARRARAARLTPKVFNNAEDFRDGITSIPNIGSYRPKSWELVEELFVDSYGLEAPGEPALTVSQLKATGYREGMGYAIIEAGQFQLYIGIFKHNF